MSWTNEEVKRVKIVIMRPVPKADNLSVIFSVTKKQKSEFEQMLTDYLTFVEANKGIVHKIEEILDAETSESYELIVSVAGVNQQAFAQELQSRARTFTVI